MLEKTTDLEGEIEDVMTAFEKSEGIELCGRPPAGARTPRPLTRPPQFARRHLLLGSDSGVYNKTDAHILSPFSLA